MAIKKSALYSAIWKSCDELRGGMDASQYKDYVLVILFLKYISDKQKADPDSMLNEIPDGCTFDDIIKLKSKAGIGEALNTRLEKIARAFNLGDGFFNNADFDNEEKLGKGKDLIDTVSNLIDVFQNPALDFGNNRAADDDLIGDAYEYLMRNFASQSGKSKGQFYTPAEASRLAAKLLDIGSDKRKRISIYDMTVGSGSLLLRAGAESNAEATFLYGQEKDLATLNMAKMNMILHGMDGYADLRHGDTLNSPAHLESGDYDNGFNYCVANPPFSVKGWMKSAKSRDIYGRWDATDENLGIPPKGKADFAFLLHLVRSLDSTGRGACFLPHGVLFRGSIEKYQDEAIVRKNLIEKHIIKGIIGLPPNLFYGTPIAACIIIIDKAVAKDSKGIFMVDAKDGFRKDGSKNRLREQDIRRVLDTWGEKKNVEHYSRMISWQEIKDNQYNLNISRYITPRNTEPNQDLHAHLCGGISKADIDDMETLWKVCPSLKNDLFTKSSDKGYFHFTNDAENNLEQSIENDASFIMQSLLFDNEIKEWKDKMNGLLDDVIEGCQPKKLIEECGAGILNIFSKNKTLVDVYDVFDTLMIYWDEVMQDDVFMISRDGWKISVELPKTKDGKIKKTYSYESIQCDLLPTEVLIDTLFYPEKAKIDSLREQIASLDVAMNEIVEEFGNMFEQAVNDKNQIQNKDLRVLLKNAKKKPNDYDADEVKAWKDYVHLLDEQDNAKNNLKKNMFSLTVSVQNKYKEFTTDEIRDIVFNDKWMKQMRSRLENLMQSAQQSIVASFRELADRYADTLPELESDVDVYRKQVAKDLHSMGFGF